MLSRSARSTASQLSWSRVSSLGAASSIRRGVMRGMPPPQFADLAAPGQLLRAVLADRLEHPQPRPVGDRLQQRLVDQGRQQLIGLARAEFPVGAAAARAHGGDRGGGRPGREDGEPLGEQPLGGGEQLPAPLDDGAQRAVPRQRGAAAAGEQPEPVGQPPGYLGERQRPQPGGGELDRQRKAVKPPDDVGDQRAGLAVEGEIRADRRCPVGEQAARRGLRQGAGRRTATPR